MREGWTYKRLAEVCTTITDGSHNPPKGIEHSKYRMISSQNIYDGELKIYDDNVRFLTEEDHYKEDKRTKLSKGVVLLTIVGTIGRSCVLNGNEGYLTLQRSVAVLHPSSEIQSRFLMYCLIGNRNKIEKEAHGIAQRGIYLKQLSTLVIPIPPNNVQQSIVAELDKINELIGLKKSQLSDLDSLVQSIFYEMFGDPVVNEKGWEVKRLGDLCEISSAKRVFIEEVVDSGVPFIRGTELTALSKLARGEKMNYTLFITQEHYERLKAITGVPKVGDLLIPSINSEGIVWMVDTEEPLYFKDGRVLWVHVNKDVFTSEALQKTMNVLIKNIFSSMNGATFAELKLFILRDLLVPLPPLPLQQSFAARINAIEQQKQRISASIKDLETIMASRMQYWFD